MEDKRQVVHLSADSGLPPTSSHPPRGGFECRTRNRAGVPVGSQESITTALLAPNHNFGKDEYAVDLAGHEARYWQGTESGLLGAFEFKGACTAGDGSCDIGSTHMGAGF